jgi:hypothetical protein
MFKSIASGHISRKAALTPNQEGKRCKVIIDHTSPIEMVFENFAGKPGGVRWYFICPVTAKRCRKLYLIGNTYQHRSAIKNFYRKNRPEWWSEKPINEILKLKQASIDAEREMTRKYFKRTYNGKPTKKYITCKAKVKAANGITMESIVNSAYN